MEYTFQKMQSRKRITLLDIAMAVCGVILLFTPARIPGALLLLTAIFGVLTKRPDVFIIGDDGITWRALRKKFYPWSSVNQVILKDGMLTIDLTNNTLIQSEVQTPHLTGGEADFNHYCRQRKAAVNQ
jgi:hypothetical protein